METINNLIIGSSGFIGQYLCRYLVEKGETVRKYDIISNNLEDCRFNKLPLNNIDRVYFLGWKVGGANYLYDPGTQKEQLDWNIKILTNTMNQLENIPFVFASSQLAEMCDTVYGVLKRLGEVWTKLTKHGVAVRLWNVYGVFEPTSIKSHVVADFIHQAINQNKILMLTNGKEKRQFIHIEDVCSALHLAFDFKEGPYDISSLTWEPICNIAALISKYTGCVIVSGAKLGTTVMIDNKQLIPGWSYKINLDDGIKRTIELFRKQNDKSK